MALIDDIEPIVTCTKQKCIESMKFWVYSLPFNQFNQGNEQCSTNQYFERKDKNWWTTLLWRYEKATSNCEKPQQIW